jgi:hypothetical protein
MESVLGCIQYECFRCSSLVVGLVSHGPLAKLDPFPMRASAAVQSQNSRQFRVSTQTNGRDGMVPERSADPAVNDWHDRGDV